MLNKYHRSWIIVLSFVASFILTIIPLPVLVATMRPEWVAMVLIYWCLVIPERIGLNTAWSIGVIHDVLTGALLGQHTLFLCFIAYFTLKWHKQIRSYSIWQQTLAIFGLLLISEGILSIILYFLQNQILHLSAIYPAIVSMLLWRWLSVLLHDLHSKQNFITIAK